MRHLFKLNKNKIHSKKEYHNYLTITRKSFFPKCYIIQNNDFTINNTIAIDDAMFVYPYIFAIVYGKSITVYDLNMQITKKIKYESIEFFHNDSIMITKIENKYKYWDLKTLKPAKKFIEGNRTYFFQNYFVTINEKSIQLWDLKNLSFILEFEKSIELGYVENVCITENEKYLITNTISLYNYSQISKWDLITGELIETFISEKIYKKNDRRYGYDKKLKLIGAIDSNVVVDYDNYDYLRDVTFTLVNIETYKTVYDYRAEHAYVNYLRKSIISRERDLIKIFNIETKKIEVFGTVDKNDGFDVRYKVSDDNSFAILLNENSNLLVFDFSTGQSKIIIPNETFHSFVTYFDNKSILALTLDLRLMKIDYINGIIVENHENVPFDAKEYMPIKLTPDCNNLVVKQKKGGNKLYMWSLNSNDCLLSNVEEINFYGY